MGTMGLCEGAAMDAAFLLERPDIQVVPPCDEVAEVDVATASGSFRLCAGCAQALGILMAIAPKVIQENRDALLADHLERADPSPLTG